MTPTFDRFRGTDTYVTSEPLLLAVNAAIALARPLLIKGEPGTGKTVLARHVADSLGMELVTWNVKSTTKARQGLYEYDVVQRLNDSRFADRDVDDIGRYIRMGPLGRVFRSEEQVVLLIDEIDKADIEFPNDLLQELDEMTFDIVETGEQVTAKNRPVVLITSNAEKELPDAFLRRCVFHYIAFPDASLMAQIVRVHFPQIEERLLEVCLRKFFWLRGIDEVRKKPSTSELLDWVKVLVHAGVPLEGLERALPFLGTLIKQERDLGHVARRGGGSR
ncbi:MAG: AAA family ATPase [Planctomycetota bacterium]|jgi:MoxR-like ATPase